MTTILGIDIGGTGIKGAPVDLERGELAADRLRIPTPEGGRPDDVAEVVAQIVAHFEGVDGARDGCPAPKPHAGSSPRGPRLLPARLAFW
jgi:predicted NBD/HSP70 family sugar kinase